MALAIAAMFAYVLWYERAERIAAAGKNTADLAYALEEHARQTLLRVDRALGRGVRAAEVRALDVAGYALPDALGSVVATDGLLHDLLLIGADGRVRYRTRETGDDAADFAQHDYFAVHRGGAGTGLYIGTAVRGADGRPIVPVSRRLSAPDGRFAGVLAGFLDVSHFKAFYDSLNLGSGGRGFVALHLRSGWILARSPADEARLPLRWSGAPPLEHGLLRPASGTLRGMAPSGGSETVYSYRALAEYPVAVSIGVPLADVLASWHAHAQRAAAVLVALLACIGLASLLLGRALAARASAEDRLRVAVSSARACTWEWHITADRLDWHPDPAPLLGPRPAAGYPDFREMVAPEDRERFLALGRAAMAAGEDYRSEFAIRRTDGELRKLRAAGRVQRADDGRALRMLGVTWDITEEGREQRFAALEHDVTRALAAARQRAEGIEAVLRLVCEAQRWSCGRFFAVDAQAPRARLEASWDDGSPDAQRFAAQSRGVSFACGEGLVGLAWATRSPVWTPDAGTDPRVVHGALARDTSIRAGIVLPVIAEDTVLGVVAYSSVEMRELDAREADGLAAICAQLGQFVLRRTAEARLLASEARLRAVFDLGLVGMAINRPDGGFLEVNEALAEMVGYAKAELLRRDWASITHPEDRERDQARYQRLLAGELASYRLEKRYLRRDGSVLQAEVSVACVRDADGEPRFTVALVQDLSARRRAERELQVIMDAVPAAIARVSNDQRYTFVNRRFAQMRGWPVDDIVGRSVRDVLGEENYRTVASAIGRALAGETVRNEATYAVPEGERVLSVAYVPDRDAAGAMAGYFVFAVDVTERNALERRLRELNETLEARVAERTAELSAALEQMESFSYSISHDLRAPLRAIDGYSRILAEEQSARLDEEGRHLLSRIAANTRSMGELIDGLLEFARVGGEAVAREPVDMRALAEEALEELGARGRAEVALGPLPGAVGDARLLRQVWRNLLSNAVKFSADAAQPRIEIGADGPADAPVYFVRDNGAGFDMRYAAKLFGVFQRLHGAEEFGGTGIGLALVRRIVQKHGGRVFAEGAPGKGAIFRFTVGG